MGLKSRYLVTIALLFVPFWLIACREGPYAIPVPTPGFNKTFPVVDEPLPEAGESQGPNLAAARSVFNASCLACHPDSGSPIAPGLKNISGRSDLASFSRVVRDGRGMMPAFKADKLSDADLAGIWEFLNGGAPPPAQSAQAKPASSPAPTKPPVAPGVAAVSPDQPAAPTASAAKPSSGAGAGQGKKLFDQQCNMCHPGAGAGVGPSLKGGKTTEESFKQVVRTGKGAMPAYGIDRIGDADIEALWSYVKDLK